MISHTSSKLLQKRKLLDLLEETTITTFFTVLLLLHFKATMELLSALVKSEQGQCWEHA